MRLPPTRALLAFAFLLPCATPAGATAGFAESHSDLVYSDRASLHWIHPGDGCDCGKFCFELVRKESRYAGFRDFNRSIGKINAPAAAGRPLIFAQACGDGQWLVYDLETERYLADTPSYESALGVWKSQGLAEPRFADAAHGAKGLRKTWVAFREDTIWGALMWLPILVLLAFPLGFIASLLVFGRYLRTRRRRDLVLGVLLALPTLPGWWLVWVVVSRMAAHPGR